MARMIPNIMFDTGSEGEKRVFESLRSLLPKSYVVFHSLRWIAGKKQSQGEADFVIFHPNKGIIVIEVKAGLIEYNGRIWKQTNRSTGETYTMKDPEEQASGSKFKLIEIINIPNCMICHAVWFPSVSFNTHHLPLNYHADFVLDENSLQSPERSLQKTYDFWQKQTNRTTNLSASEARIIIGHLAPAMHLVPSLKLEFENREQQFIQLTQEQSRILDFLKLQKKATIAGAAGTGKTLIAIEKARQLSTDGGKVCFLCYNKLLAAYLSDKFSHYGFTVKTFDSLAASLVGVQSSFEVTRNFFLEYLIEKNNDFLYTDIVIDEGQDFEQDWLEYLDYRTKGSFYVFYDAQQSIYGDELSDFIANAPTRLTLTTNCRNTKAIALTAYGSLGHGINFPILSEIEGDQTKIIPKSDHKTNAKNINNLIKTHVLPIKLTLDRIAILTMDKWDNSHLSLITQKLDYPWTNNISEGKICITTARKFKGLEADIVILVDIDWQRFDEMEYRNLFYTSSSRAKHELYLISQEVDDIDTAFVLKQTLGDSKRKGKRKFIKLFNLKT